MQVKLSVPRAFKNTLQQSARILTLTSKRLQIVILHTRNDNRVPIYLRSLMFVKKISTVKTTIAKDLLRAGDENEVFLPIRQSICCVGYTIYRLSNCSKESALQTNTETSSCIQVINIEIFYRRRFAF